jgi:hypothetical protein
MLWSANDRPNLSTDLIGNPNFCEKGANAIQSPQPQNPAKKEKGAVIQFRPTPSWQPFESFSLNSCGQNLRIGHVVYKFVKGIIKKENRFNNILILLSLTKFINQ